MPPSLLAYVLFVLPALIGMLAGARRDCRPGAMAMLVTGAMAADMLLILLLARIWPLGLAAWVARGCWVVGALFYFVHRHRRGFGRERPSWLGWRAGLACSGASAVALAASLRLTRTCALWDRQWHIPLVGSLRGQTMPFVNVYLQDDGLYYHFTGNVAAAVLQSLSGAVLHASSALSLSRDIYFALFGLCLGLVLCDLGIRRVAVTALAPLAALYAGPLAMFRRTVHSEAGYSAPSFMWLSLRPHAPLSLFFCLGFVTALLLRADVDRERAPLRWTWLLAILSLCTAVLAITDELSLGLVGLGFGIVWLVRPDLLGATRAHGAAVLTALLAAIGFSAVLFIGSIGPGAPHLDFSLTKPRSPGFYTPEVPLATWEGFKLWIQDLGPILVLWVGAVVWAARLAARSAGRAMVILLSGILTAGIVLFSTGQHAGSGLESHRFLVAPMVLAPTLAIIALVLAARHRSAATVLGSASSLAMLAAMLFPVIGNIAFVESGAAGEACAVSRGFWGDPTYYETDCRRETGARIDDRLSIGYAEQSVFYLFSGCRPLRVLGVPQGEKHDIVIGWPQLGPGTLQQLPRYGRSRFKIFCSAHEKSSDPVCRVAARKGRCRRRGDEVSGCVIELDSSGVIKAVAEPPTREKPPILDGGHPNDGGT